MSKNINDIQWGPTNSPEYPWFMVGIFGVCGLGLASSVIPGFESILTSIFILLGIGSVAGIIYHVLRERHKDWQAFYGPLPQGEGEEETQQKEVQ